MYMYVFEKYGEDVVMFINFSVMYLELGEYEFAAVTANRAFEENVVWRKGYYCMGVVYEKMGKKCEVMEVYRCGIVWCGVNV